MRASKCCWTSTAHSSSSHSSSNHSITQQQQQQSSYTHTRTHVAAPRAQPVATPWLPHGLGAQCSSTRLLEPMHKHRSLQPKTSQQTQSRQTRTHTCWWLPVGGGNSSLGLWAWPKANLCKVCVCGGLSLWAWPGAKSESVGLARGQVCEKFVSVGLAALAGGQV